jgi:hypothetical protein
MTSSGGPKPEGLRHLPPAAPARPECDGRPRSAEGLFSTPVRNNLPTWRVCEPCQDRLDPAEERLLNLFVRGPSLDP